MGTVRRNPTNPPGPAAAIVEARRINLDVPECGVDEWRQ